MPKPRQLVTILGHPYPSYKEWVRQTKPKQFNKFTADDWHRVVLANLKKAHWLVNGLWERPPHDVFISSLGQGDIFARQLAVFIRPDEKVAVLSAFPFFVAEYFGADYVGQLAADDGSQAQARDGP